MSGYFHSMKRNIQIRLENCFDVGWFKWRGEETAMMTQCIKQNLKTNILAGDTYKCNVKKKGRQKKRSRKHHYTHLDYLIGMNSWLSKLLFGTVFHKTPKALFQTMFSGKNPIKAQMIWISVCCAHSPVHFNTTSVVSWLISLQFRPC